MLPFLKRKESQSAGLIIKTRKPDQVAESVEENDASAAHEACARDLLRAIESKDIKGIAEALQSAFEIMDSEPHVEGEHVEPHSYDAQNQKAAQNE